MDRPPIVDAANRNYVGSYRTLASHSADGAFTEIGSVMTFATGVPISFFNGCLALRSTTATEIDAAIESLEARGVPYQLFVDAEVAAGLVDHLRARGFNQDRWSMPGMVLSPVPRSAVERPGVRVDVVDEAGIDEWRHVLTDSWLPPELADQLFPTSLATDPDVRLFTARLDGRPVGASVAIRTGDVSGVYGVVTVPTARRRRVGTAAHVAAVPTPRRRAVGTVTTP